MLGRHRGVARLLAWTVPALAATSCALAVDWDALRRGKPESPDGSSQVPDAHSETDASAVPPADSSPLKDAHVTPLKDAIAPAGDATTADSGTCTPDPTVACPSDPAYSGFSCTGAAQPSSSFSGLACMPAGGAAMTYCCEGNWCGVPSDNPCDTCTATFCAAADCLCANLGPSLDDAGDTACWDYTGCVYACPDSLSACESECVGPYSGQTLGVGNADLGCEQRYCTGPCGL